ncbi:DUF2461 domain-containing protein [Thalassoglobus sp. JC818]|uniref:DUF2461 domain-containing protein n=1 Tax=Thalassoglobus sp. JC818 TaxID=3232136 RepID=UPI00345AFCA7
MGTFNGFPPSVFQFLAELEANNDKDWFDANRDRYESEVRSPALEYIAAMQGPIEKISSHFRVEPKKVGGSLMRVHRDTRFSKDKTPYKTNIGIQFRHEAGKDVHAPGFYLHISPEECFVAAGVWHPAGEDLAAIRKAIIKHSKDWKAAVSDAKFVKRFALTGDSLKRSPRGIDPDHPLIDDLKRKDFIGLSNFEPGLVTSPKFVNETAKAFKSADRLMAFLCSALSIKY